MNRAEFEEIAAEEFATIPPKYAALLKNVALLVEEVGSGDLLGLYQGVPAPERGDGYGNLGTLPDTVTLFYLPLMKEAEEVVREARAASLPDAVRLVIRETLWHEIAHHFGMDDPQVELREEEGTNRFRGS